MSKDDQFMQICNKLDSISKTIDDMDKRLVVLENKTTELHSHIPFVSWLEDVGRDISGRFRWLKGHKDPPLITCDK